MVNPQCLPSVLSQSRQHTLPGNFSYCDFNYPLCINNSKSMFSTFNSLQSCRPECSTILQTTSLDMPTVISNPVKQTGLDFPMEPSLLLFLYWKEPHWPRNGKPSPHITSCSLLPTCTPNWEQDLGVAPSSASLGPIPFSTSSLFIPCHPPQM